MIKIKDITEKMDYVMIGCITGENNPNKVQFILNHNKPISDLLKKDYWF
jgi:hypothetical protein